MKKQEAVEASGPQAWQVAMGCPGCRFCDEKALAKGVACCTYFGKLLTSGKTCLCRLGRGDDGSAKRRDMKTLATTDLRGMVAEGCQGHAEANEALAELCRRANSAERLAEVADRTMAHLRNGCPREGGLKAMRVDEAAMYQAAKDALAKYRNG